MTEYIEREAAVKICSDQYKECLRKSDWCGDTVAWNIGVGIQAIPAADVVSKAVFDQVMWERNTAITQLREDYGVGLGEKKADVFPVVHGRWVPSITGHDVCSECRKIYTSGWFTAHGIKARESFNYCPNCGARMDGE